MITNYFQFNATNLTAS